MADFPIRDRRGLRPTQDGLVVARGRSEVESALAGREAAQALDRGRQGPAETDWSIAGQMRRSRRATLRATASGGADVAFATQRPRDPTFYWRDSGLPYEVDDEKELAKLREWCRFIYRAHPTLGSVIDIFATFPILGMEFRGKDQKLVDFYTELMLDDDSALNYREFLEDVGREYWITGEAWPLGTFNELLGVWEADELLNPDDVFVERSAFQREPRYTIRLPEPLRRVLREGRPAWEYDQLVQAYPELRYYVGDEARMPVSPVLLYQYRHKGDTFNPRGVPRLMRALRAAVQEEMLNSAQDAIADRLYTPLVLARLGASASDLGTQQPWVPTEDDLDNFRDNLDTALAADFRVLVTHFATQMDSVFGRETMPNFDADFERLEEKQLQAFGISKTALSGAGTGETYAADALNRDLVTQLLTAFQRQHQRFLRKRMLVVAEAQGHYDYEERNGTRHVVNEEVLVVDEDGTQRIEERPKLLVPDVRFAVMNMHDDDTQRQFLEALRASGIPISMRTRLVNVPVDFDDEIAATREEQVQLAVEAQETRREIYRTLRDKRLPIPPDLREDFSAKPTNAQEIQDAAAQQAAMEALEAGGMGARVPQLGVDQDPATALAPTPDELMMPPGIPTQLPEGTAGEVDPTMMGGMGASAPVASLPRNRARPPESDEMRRGMPVASALAPEDASGLPGVGRDPATGAPVRVSGMLTEGPSHVGRRLARYYAEDGEEPKPAD